MTLSNPLTKSEAIADEVTKTKIPEKLLEYAKSKQPRHRIEALCIIRNLTHHDNKVELLVKLGLLPIISAEIAILNGKDSAVAGAVVETVGKLAENASLLATPELGASVGPIVDFWKVVENAELKKIAVTALRALAKFGKFPLHGAKLTPRKI